MKTACIQISSGADMAANIARVEALVGGAAEQGAEFVALPENAFYMRAEGEAPPPRHTQATHPGVKAAAKMAKQHGIWLLAGSVAVAGDRDAGDGKTYNRSILFNPQGKVVAHYDKIHLFDVDVGDGQTYRESSRILSGTRAVVADLTSPSPASAGEGRGGGGRATGVDKDPLPDPPPLRGRGDIKLGLTICYDLRFPQLYRTLAKRGAEMLAVPAAFTQVTGEAHWHVLLRARAIENACFVIAPAQTGTHPGGRKTYGHSLIVDPWGKVLADGGVQEGIVMAEINPDEVKKVRHQLPSLEHDRVFE